MAIGVRFPFQDSTEGGMFRYTKTSEENIRTNLISLLTTKKQHRVMNNNLYSPLYDYVFEQWDDISKDELDSKLKKVIDRYIPEVTVVDIVYTFDELTNVLNVNVVYGIDYLPGLSYSVEVGVVMEENIF